MSIEEAEERIDNCLAALDREVPMREPANEMFWAGVTDYLYRSLIYLREEVEEGKSLSKEREV
jgi:hypothetical protein